MKTANLTSVAIAALLGIVMLADAGCTNSKTNQETSDNMETLNLTQEWDKKFLQSDKVNHKMGCHGGESGGQKTTGRDPAAHDSGSECETLTE